MVSIEIEHDTGRSQNIILPENYNELKPGKSFLKTIKLLTMSLEPFIKYCSLALHLGNKNKKQFGKLLPTEMEHISQELAWIFDQSNIVIEESKLRRIGLLFGPADYLLNLNVYQLEDADACFMEYLNNEGSDSKNYQRVLFAVLYQPFGIPYNRWFVNNIWQHIAWLIVPKIAPEAAMINYLGLRKAFALLFPETFSKVTDEEGSVSAFGMASLINAVAGDKLGSVERVAKRNLFEIFVFLESENKTANLMKNKK